MSDIKDHILQDSIYLNCPEKYLQKQKEDKQLPRIGGEDRDCKWHEDLLRMTQMF